MAEVVCKPSDANPPVPCKSDKTIVVVPGDAAIDTSLWEMFEVRTTALDAEFTQLNNSQVSLDNEYERLTRAQSQAKDDKSAGGSRSALAGAAAGAQALTKLFSYFASDYAVGGVDLTEDHNITITAIAARTSGRFTLTTPTQVPATGLGAKDLYDTLTSLGADAARRKAWIPLGKARSAELVKLAGKNETPQQQAFKKLADDYDKTLLEATATTDRAVALFEMLADTADDNTFPLGKVVAQRRLHYAISQSAYVLFVTNYYAGGGYFTKKNILTTFGAMPFFASGGGVVHYRLVRLSDAAIAAAGVVSFACAYRKVSRVASSSVETTCAAPPG